MDEELKDLLPGAISIALSVIVIIAFALYFHIYPDVPKEEAEHVVAYQHSMIIAVPKIEHEEEPLIEKEVLVCYLPTSVVEDQEAAEEPEPVRSYMGTYELTAYISTGNPCADGSYPSVGYTVASNDPALWHKWIHIEGYGDYFVHDRGGMASNVIDVYVGSYDEAIHY